jgi:hypothetical protein
MSSEYLEIRISMKNGHVRADRNASDEAVGELPDRLTAAAAKSVERGCLFIIGGFRSLAPRLARVTAGGHGDGARRERRREPPCGLDRRSQCRHRAARRRGCTPDFWCRAEIQPTQRCLSGLTEASGPHLLQARAGKVSVAASGPTGTLRSSRDRQELWSQHGHRGQHVSRRRRLGGRRR